jgi:poly(A) polymerase
MKGEIVDPLGNFSDLAKGKVKFVGDPKKRILEDHLRILRFFRFLSKYPLQNKRVNFRTLKTINETKDLVKKLSKERIWREFKMILSSDGASLALRFMNKTGVLKVLFPSFTLKRAINLIALEEIFIRKIFKEVSCNNFEFKNPILRLSILLKNQQKPIQEVLSLNRNEIKMFNFYNKFEKYSKNFKSLGFNYGQKNGLSLLLLYIAKKKNFDIYIKSKKFEQKLLRYFGEITDGAKAMKNFPVNGNDLSKMGYSGRAIGSILERLKKTWIDSDFKLNKKQLLLKL